jgi:hypothetical protein
VGEGPGEPETEDGDGLGAPEADGLGVVDPGGVAERDGDGERLGCRARDGLGDAVGREADGVEDGVVAG